MKTVVRKVFDLSEAEIKTAVLYWLYDKGLLTSEQYHGGLVVETYGTMEDEPEDKQYVFDLRAEVVVNEERTSNPTGAGS